MPAYGAYGIWANHEFVTGLKRTNEIALSCLRTKKRFCGEGVAEFGVVSPTD